MPTDPYAQYALSGATGANNETPSTGGSDPYAQYALGGTTTRAPESSPAPQATPNPTDPYAEYATGGRASSSTTALPVANEGFLHKTWDVLNTPLLEDLGAPSSISGVGPDWLKGVERGAYKLGMGFTSPLSLALTIGTLGTGGFIESAGANILKSTLMEGGLDAAAAADKVGLFEKAAQAATDAFKTNGASVKDAVEATGMPYKEFRSLGNTLYDQGLTEKDVIGGNIVQRGLSATLRNLPSMDAVTAQKLARFTQLGMDAGFTGQQLHSAVQTVPQVFDALKDGRYDDAFEYMTEGGISGTLGLVGLSHALHQAGQTFGSINERENLRPSAENQKLNGFFGDRDEAHQSANQTAANLMQQLRDLAGANTGTTFSPSIFDNIKAGIKYTFQSAAERQAFRDKLDRLLVGLETGNDPTLAGQFADALQEAIGGNNPSLAKLNPVLFQKIISSPGFKDWFGKSQVTEADGEPKELYHGTNVAGFNEFNKDNFDENSLYGPGVYMTDDPGVASEYAGFLERGEKMPTILFGGQYRGNMTPEMIKEYYKPGNVVKSYGGGYDKVVAFHPGDPNATNYRDRVWSVDVIQTDKNGTPLSGEGTRNHSTSPDAKEYTNTKGKAVYPLIASIEHPFDTQAIFSKREAEDIFGANSDRITAETIDRLYKDKSSVTGAMLYRKMAAVADGFKGYVNRKLQNAGFDGIKYKGGQITGGKPHTAWVAFDPDQVKSTFHDFNENTFARYAPGNAANLEQQIRNLGINKPLDQIRSSDIKNAGGNKTLQDSWNEHLKSWATLSEKDSDGNYKTPNSVVSKNAAISTIPATQYSPAAMLLNPHAQELFARAIEGLQSEGKMKNISKGDWVGMFTNGEGIRNLIRMLTKQSKAEPPENRQGYDWAVQSLESALPKDGVILARDNQELEGTYQHESTHYWQNLVREDVQKDPAAIKDMNSKVDQFLVTPLADRAVKALKKIGYADASTKTLFDEIGSHLAENSQELQKAGKFSDDEFKQLAKDYLSLYDKKYLANFPSEHPLIQGALDASGNKGINAGTATALRRGSTEGLGAFGEQPGNTPGGVRNAGVSGEPAGLPDNIQKWVDEARDKLRPEQKAYINRWVKAYRAVAGGLSDDEASIVKRLREEDDKNWNIGNTMELITNHIDNHFHHLWGPDANDIGNDLLLQGRTGQLATTVTQARHRVWQTMAEGLLKGRQLVGDDPMAVIAWDRANILKAAANRNFIMNLRDNNVRGSDNRPLVVLGGEGHVVQEPNGGNPAAIINMNNVLDIRIAKNLVDQLNSTGELERFLQRGDILDVTKKFRTNNIDEAIGKLEQIGIHKTPEFDPEGSVILRKDIQTLKGIKSGAIPATALDEINERWNPPQYVWHPQDYVTPANRTLQGWNWLTKTDDGTNIIARSDVKFHPEVAQYMINRLGLDNSYLREDKGIGKLSGPVLKGTTKAKAILLSFSPFHLMQEALRGVMLGVNPLKINPIGEIQSRPDMANAVHEGATLAPDKRAIQEYSIGVAQHAPLVSKIPVLGKAMDWYQDFLFNRYIPSLKAQAIENMSSKYRAAHPDWTERAVGKAVADHVNNAFGGQNWRAMGRAAATQDWFHLLALAPDWLESEMRFAASTLRGGLKNRNFSREQTLLMAAGVWGVARVLNMVTTGNMHLEAPFGVATKDKNGREVVYSIRTMPTDILHMASDPEGFIKGRFSPFARLSEEALSGRDVFGRKLAPGDLAIDIARNMAPIPFQTLGQIETGQSSEVGNVGQIAKASGFTSTVYRTEAEKMAIQLASQHNEDGPLDPQKLKHLEAISQIEDGLRSGSMTHDQLDEARDFGGLTQSDYKKIRDNLKITQGLDPDTARMVSKVSRLPAPDALQIWDAATPKEKVALMKIMIKKKHSYISKAMRDETPNERLNDPVFRRLRLMFQEPEPENEQNP